MSEWEDKFSHYILSKFAEGPVEYSEEEEMRMFRKLHEEQEKEHKSSYYLAIKL